MPTPTFIRVVEVWVPDRDQSLLEFGGGCYGSAKAFARLSRSMCFGRGEGLPGRAWDEGRPIVLKQFEGSNFRRTEAAAAEGLTCGIAVPVFVGETLSAVLLIFCGDDESHAGAIELWRNDPKNSPDLLLDDGYYGNTAEVFEFVSRNTSFRKGTGLPGLAWEAGLPVFMPDLGKGTRFLRADSAVQVGINRGFAFPCAPREGDAYVLAFLSALATPIARRFETWIADSAGLHLTRRDGFCERTGAVGEAAQRVERGEGALGRLLVSPVPSVGERAADEPGPVGAAAREADLQSMLAFPVLRDGRVAAAVVWYF